MDRQFVTKDCYLDRLKLDRAFDASRVQNAINCSITPSRSGDMEDGSAENP